MKRNNLEYFKTLTKADILNKIKMDKGNSFICINEDIKETGNKLIAIKDIHVQSDVVTTACSKVLSEYVGNYDSTVVKLLKGAGFNIVGNLNMDQFAMGFNNETSFFGEVANAQNNDYSSGGSSGGSAYAVAKGLVPVATGTDTGGSVRQPAAFNGIYGLKPTYGLISRYGTISFASSFDTIGVMSNTLEDNMEVLKALAKEDVNDQTNYVPKGYEVSSMLNSNEKFKIGYIKEWMDEIQCETIKNNILKVIENFKKMGYEVEEVSIPTVKYSFELYMILAYSEASSNLSRYDGIRFGINNDSNEFSTYRRELGEEVKKRLVIGGYMTSAKHSKDYYQKAQQIRNKMIENFKDVFKTYDILLGPITPDVAIKKSSSPDDKTGYLYDFFAIPANLVGIPAMSMPIAKVKNNMSVSIQILANKYEEKKIYNIAQKIEDMEM